MYKNLKNKKAKFILGFILLITLNLTSLSFIHSPLNKSIKDSNVLKTSGVYYSIVINDLPGNPTNWAWAETQPWCTGSGIVGSPYIIEGHTFEFSTGLACLGILNSRKQFIINNCTIRNSLSMNAGLLLNNVTNGQILNCYIYNNNRDGIELSDASEMFISINEIYDNSWSGIYMWGTSENNTITGNIFNNNGWRGVEIYSDNNLFYNNYFTNPGLGHAEDNGFFNSWNNSIIGNYWDDYVGYDMDLDGIGDTPYDVPPGGGSQDYLPIWNIQAPISIDDLPSSLNNWAWAVSQAWCRGSGTSVDPYIIEDLIIDGEGIDNCIFVQNSNKHFIIRNCKVYNSGTIGSASGIQLANVTNSQIVSNNASNNELFGITLIDCDYNIISGNIVNHNTGFGILLAASHNNIVSGNTANYNHQYGIYLDSSSFNTLSENTASDNPASNFYLFNSHNNILHKNIADKVSSYGIFLDTSHSNEISECEVYNISSRGIYLFDSNNNTISKNIAMYNLWGLYAEFSNDNTFFKNTFNNNTQLGMGVDFSINNKILENTANFNTIVYGGIMVANSIDTLVQDNTIIGNSPMGIGIIFGSDNINVTGNVIKENTFGIEIDPGADNNLMYENFFLKNEIHAVDLGLNNDWNSTTIGNYWDNHTGPDVNPNDGIVDSPYTYIQGPTAGIDYLPIADDTPPTIMINSPTDGNLFGTDAPNYDVTITDDNLFEMWYTIDGGLNNYTFTGFTGTIDQSVWNAMADGTITLTFYASDKAGNIGYADVDIIKDTQAPIIVINSPSIGDTFGTSAPSFIVQISDDNLDSMWYSLDGDLTNFTITANGTIDQTAWSSLSQGNVTITFYANDTVGNLASESVNVEKDIPAPGDNFIIIIIVISIVSGAAIATAVIVLVLRKRKAGEEVID